MLFFFSSRRRHTRFDCDWSSDVCSSDLDVFRKVLTLDPENVLGLKMLADIAERGKRYDEAVEWLSRLLSADPMNGDRKSTRLNSSHSQISYAVFCLKKKTFGRQLTYTVAG